MKRVSSRQRLVSWDAFDGAFDGANVEEDSSGSDYESSPLIGNGIAFVAETGTAVISKDAVTHEMMVKTSISMDSYASSLKRKRAPARVCAFAWELESGNKTCWFTLPTEVQLSVLSFLAPSDVTNVMQTSTQLRQLLTHSDADWLWKYHCQQAWPQCPAACSQYTVSIPTWTKGGTGASSAVKFHELLPLAPKHFPSVIDETLLAPCRWSRSLRRYRSRGPTELTTVVTQKGKTAIQFTGVVGSGDRCIRADYPWLAPAALIPVVSHTLFQSCSPLSRMFHPCHQQQHSRFIMRNTSAGSGIHQQGSFMDRLRRHKNSGVHERPLRWRPFVLPFVQQTQADGTKLYNITPRLVQYFEVAILPKPPTAVSTRSPDPEVRFRHARGTPECVAVGISSQHFSLHTRMPGWDHCSYGYHGDDGGVFFGTGHMLKEYGPTFGAGDVVGCGIDYHHGNIFYTLNGKYLGVAWDNLNADFYGQDWYPTVGIDTTCLIRCNFGIEDEPFQFDLSSYIRQHHEIPMLERQEHCQPAHIIS